VQSYYNVTQQRANSLITLLSVSNTQQK